MAQQSSRREQRRAQGDGWTVLSFGAANRHDYVIGAHRLFRVGHRHLGRFPSRNALEQSKDVDTERRCKVNDDVNDTRLTALETSDSLLRTSNGLGQFRLTQPFSFAQDSDPLAEAFLHFPRYHGVNYQPARKRVPSL